MKRKSGPPKSRKPSKNVNILDKQDTRIMNKKPNLPPLLIDETETKNAKATGAILEDVFAEIELIQVEYKHCNKGYRDKLRSLIARAARWALETRGSGKMVEEFKRHAFWGNQKPPKNFMQAVMAFMASTRSASGLKLAHKRQRAVDFLLDEGCDPNNLEQALREGIEKLYIRATQANPKRKKKEPAASDQSDTTDTQTNSSAKSRPVFFTGNSVKKLNNYKDGALLTVTMQIVNTEKRLLKLISVKPRAV